MQGWFSIHRELLGHSIWLSEPFTRGQAWVDMIGLANHFPGHIRTDKGVRIDLERGQLGWSERKLAERWKWSRGKLRRFFNELKEDGRISREAEPGKSKENSVITIINYTTYQSPDTKNDTTTNTRSEPGKDQKQYPNNNANPVFNEKNEKQIDVLSSIFEKLLSEQKEKYQRLDSENVRNAFRLYWEGRIYKKNPPPPFSVKLDMEEAVKLRPSEVVKRMKKAAKCGWSEWNYAEKEPEEEIYEYNDVRRFNRPGKYDKM